MIIYIKYFEALIRLNVNDYFYIDYIKNYDSRIIEIDYINSFLHIITENEDLIEELECRFNPDF